MSKRVDGWSFSSIRPARVLSANDLSHHEAGRFSVHLEQVGCGREVRWRAREFGEGHCILPRRYIGFDSLIIGADFKRVRRQRAKGTERSVAPGSKHRLDRARSRSTSIRAPPPGEKEAQQTDWGGPALTRDRSLGGFEPLQGKK